MKIAIAGKGGSGKTTIAGILSRLLAERGDRVWAIDADSNPNLGTSIGASAETRKTVRPLEGSILTEVTDARGERTRRLAMPAHEVAKKFGLQVTDRMTLMVMGTVDHAGEG